MSQARVEAYVEKLGLDATEVARRRAFFQITDDDLERLQEHKAFAEQTHEDIVEGFYTLILDHPETRAYMHDADMMRRLKRTQTRYFLDLFDGRVDVEYAADRLRVGMAHERIGLPVKWYLGAYSNYLRLVLHKLLETEAPDKAVEVFDALQKVVFFDATLAIDTYALAQLETLARHQQAIRELSTPVIGVHPGVLLLPLVGTVDSHRAQQIMETVLARVSEEQAKVILLDIAGVPVVDTQVADYLLKATAAVRLLGASTILTGISPQVARTIVELGVDISTMHTRSKLSDGIELALTMVGKRIVEVAP